MSLGQLGEQQRQVRARPHADLLHAQPARPISGERVVRQQQRANALVGEGVAAHVERIERPERRAQHRAAFGAHVVVVQLELAQLRAAVAQRGGDGRARLVAHAVPPEVQLRDRRVAARSEQRAAAVGTDLVPLERETFERRVLRERRRHLARALAAHLVAAQVERLQRAVGRQPARQLTGTLVADGVGIETQGLEAALRLGLLRKQLAQRGGAVGARLVLREVEDDECWRAAAEERVNQ